jgi:predicted transposase/invertase (TIGR01784 family)
MEKEFTKPYLKKIYEKLFAAAEIAKYSREEREQYEESLKYYRDIKNVIDTAFEDGELKGKIEGKIEERQAIAKKMKAMGIPFETIVVLTGLSKDEIEKL